MQFSAFLALLLSICTLTTAYTCASWVPPEECLKSAKAFSAKMATATLTRHMPASTLIDGSTPSREPSEPPPPKHRNCGTLAMIDAPPCDKMYRPQAAQPSPLSQPTTLATAVRRAAPSSA